MNETITTYNKKIMNDFIKAHQVTEFLPANAPDEINLNGFTFLKWADTDGFKNGKYTNVYQSKQTNVNGEYLIAEITIKQVNTKNRIIYKFDNNNCKIW